MKTGTTNELKISLRGSLANEYAKQKYYSLIDFINQKRLLNQVDKHQDREILVVYKKNEKHLFCSQHVSKREWMGKKIKG
ncbi:MAG: hypothetical protein GY860_18965 [Desulfobacteraceae bacterium]|nr:hypothetical protein [Desulfobacteraceae bacterium]